MVEDDMYDFGYYGCVLPYQPVQKCKQVLQDEVYGLHNIGQVTTILLLQTVS